MTAALQPKKIYSIDEYIELEKSSNEKFEFWDGTVWSMSGARTSHNRIVRNLGTELDTILQVKGCESFPSDMRIKVPAYEPYRYPDLTALCGEPLFEEFKGIEMLVNPQLIVEVLSDSSEAFDRGDKFTYYKSIPSFAEYVLIAQHRPHLTQFVRHGDGFWANYEYNDMTDIVEFRTIHCTVSMARIYRGVTFPEPNLSLSETVQST